MPYTNEYANKSSHSDIIKNPEVSGFLQQCQYLKQPTDQEIEALASVFKAVPQYDIQAEIPRYVLAVDGSNYESSLNQSIPSSKIGYIKIGSILIDLQEFSTLREGKFVDPFRVARLQDNNSALTFLIPSSNIRWGEHTTVRDSFRAFLDQQLYDHKTRFSENDPNTSLRTTLFHLAAHRPGILGTGNPQKLKIHACPSCNTGPIEILDTNAQQYCPQCKNPVYASDSLRLWEDVNEFQSNQVPMTRLMLILEHLIPIHYIRYLLDKHPASLGEMAFFIDGPLAIFGNAAWLHRSIMIFLSEMRVKLAKNGLQQPVIVGLQKTGAIVDFLSLINKEVPKGTIYAIEDEYRYTYIYASRTPSESGFGHETYYGQDFMLKTSTGKTFALAIPYPTDSKDSTTFLRLKTDISMYSQLQRTLATVSYLESDLYENAVVPIALAHKYTSISLVPGGRVLDILTQKGLQ